MCCVGRVEIQIDMVGVLPIPIVKSNVSSSAGSILDIIKKFDTWLCRYRYFFDVFDVFDNISNVDTFDT